MRYKRRRAAACSGSDGEDEILPSQHRKRAIDAMEGRLANLAGEVSALQSALEDLRKLHGELAAQGEFLNAHLHGLPEELNMMNRAADVRALGSGSTRASDPGSTFHFSMLNAVEPASPGGGASAERRHPRRKNGASAADTRSTEEQYDQHVGAPPLAMDFWDEIMMPNFQEEYRDVDLAPASSADGAPQFAAGSTTASPAAGVNTASGSGPSSSAPMNAAAPFLQHGPGALHAHPSTAALMQSSASRLPLACASEFTPAAAVASGFEAAVLPVTQGGGSNSAGGYPSSAAVANTSGGAGAQHGYGQAAVGDGPLGDLTGGGSGMEALRWPSKPPQQQQDYDQLCMESYQQMHPSNALLAKWRFGGVPPPTTQYMLPTMAGPHPVAFSSSLRLRTPSLPPPQQQQGDFQGPGGDSTAQRQLRWWPTQASVGDGTLPMQSPTVCEGSVAVVDAAGQGVLSRGGPATVATRSTGAWKSGPSGSVPISPGTPAGQLAAMTAPMAVATGLSRSLSASAACLGSLASGAGGRSVSGGGGGNGGGVCDPAGISLSSRFCGGSLGALPRSGKGFSGGGGPAVAAAALLHDASVAPCLGSLSMGSINPLGLGSAGSGVGVRGGVGGRDGIGGGTLFRMPSNAESVCSLMQQQQDPLPSQQQKINQVMRQAQLQLPPTHQQQPQRQLLHQDEHQEPLVIKHEQQQIHVKLELSSNSMSMYDAMGRAASGMPHDRLQPYASWPLSCSSSYPPESAATAAVIPVANCNAEGISVGGMDDQATLLAYGGSCLATDAPAVTLPSQPQMQQQQPNSSAWSGDDFVADSGDNGMVRQRSTRSTVGKANGAAAFVDACESLPAPPNPAMPRVVKAEMFRDSASAMEAPPQLPCGVSVRYRTCSGGSVAIPPQTLPLPTPGFGTCEHPWQAPYGVPLPLTPPMPLNGSPYPMRVIASPGRHVVWRRLPVRQPQSGCMTPLPLPGSNGLPPMPPGCSVPMPMFHPWGLPPSPGAVPLLSSEGDLCMPSRSGPGVYAASTETYGPMPPPS